MEISDVFVSVADKWRLLFLLGMFVMVVCGWVGCSCLAQYDCQQDNQPIPQATFIRSRFPKPRRDLYAFLICVRV